MTVCLMTVSWRLFVWWLYYGDFLSDDCLSDDQSQYPVEENTIDCEYLAYFEPEKNKKIYIEILSQWNMDGK